MLEAMKLDPDVCYRAVASRDPRFDGLFFTGVRTTGIYCRPVCPARTPRRQNVRFFACAAAAEEAGFRPCLRCRPETAPGTPAWTGAAASVTRALRLIDEGFLDDRGVNELAAVLGVGPRHLRRLFDLHLGASPVRVAVSRRVHLARRLVEDSDLSLTEIAFASGFASVRRFNDAFRRVFGCAPSSLRRAGVAGATTGVRLRLRRRAPYHAGAVTAFLAARAVVGMERVNPGYRRVVSIGRARGDTVGDALGVVEVTPGSDGVTLSVSPSLTGSLSEVVARTRRVFDVDADPQAISTQLSRDPALATAVARCPGLPVAGAWDGYEMTVRAIVGQQVSVAAARSMLSRITAAYGKPADIDGETWVAFPTAQRLARARLERLGVIASRARAIREVSRRVADGSLDIDGGREPGRVVEALTAIPGVGPWTASMVAMRALGDPDAFPVTDLGLLKAARVVLGTRTARELEKRAERWRPWRAYAAAYLWQDAVSTVEVCE